MKPLVKKEYTTQLVVYKNKRESVTFREISYDFTVFGIPLFNKTEHTQLPEDYNIQPTVGFVNKRKK